MILVTGASGFIGSAFCRLLVDHEAEFIATDRKRTGRLKGRFIQADLTRPEELEPLFRSGAVSTVVHLASLLATLSREQPLLAAKTNITGSLHLLEACKKHKVSRFIYGSSIGAYLNDIPNTRTDHQQVDMYGNTKRFMELLGSALKEKGQPDFIALRIPIVIGPGVRSEFSVWRSQLVEFLNTRIAQTVRIPFSRESPSMFTDVSEVARALLTVVQAGSWKRNVYDLPYESCTMEELCDKVRSLNPLVQFEFGDNVFPQTILDQADNSSFIADFRFSPRSFSGYLKNHYSLNQKR